VKTASSQPPGKSTCLILAALVMMLCLLPLSTTEAASAEERKVSLTIAFIYNITKFIQWPKTDQAYADDVLPVCFTGMQRWEYLIAQKLWGKTTGKRKVIARFLQQPEDAKQCAVLYIGSQRPVHYLHAINHLPEQNVLTISENRDFLYYGGIMRFFTERNKLRFEVNIQAAQKANVHISSKLLGLAKIYKPEEHEE